MYGAVGGEANAIAPNKRMLSSMVPTIVLKDNKPYIVVGTPVAQQFLLLFSGYCRRY